MYDEIIYKFINIIVLFVSHYNKLLRKGILDINIEILDDKLNKASVLLI